MTWPTPRRTDGDMSDVALPTLAADLTSHISDVWTQGRTAFGGCSAALALQGAKRIAGPLPPLRSAQISFVGPIVGDVRVEGAVLRRGKHSAWVDARLMDADGNVGTAGLFLFMDERTHALDYSALPFPAEDFSDEPLPDHPQQPAFIGNFERYRHGSIADGFRTRARLRAAPDDAEVGLMAMADLLPIAAVRLLQERVTAASSATWQVNVVGDVACVRDGFYIAENRTLHAAHGGVSMTHTLWATDGTPICTGTQSAVLF